jgi:hypothetical protein
VPKTWPDSLRGRIKELRRRHDRLFRDIIVEGVAIGAFTVISGDTMLRSLHAGMAQAPAW